MLIPLVTVAKFCGGNHLGIKGEVPDILVNNLLHHLSIPGVHSQSLARPLTVTLVRVGLVGPGYDIASYVLDSFDDYIARCKSISIAILLMFY